jgi:hypothetical protein
MARLVVALLALALTAVARFAPVVAPLAAEALAAHWAAAAIAGAAN